LRSDRWITNIYNTNKYCGDGLYLADDAGDCPCLGHLCGEVPVMVVDTE
jgi:hypothetical protein